MSEIDGFERFFKNPPRRVVSLVPAMTESLFDLEVGQTLVGISDDCIYPADRTQGLVNVGKPADPQIVNIESLKPDLVIADEEFTPGPILKSLGNSGFLVWRVHPTTVRQAVNGLWQLAKLFQNDRAIIHLLPLETSLEWTQAYGEDGATWTYFCPLWTSVSTDGQPWWGTFNRETYPADLLRHFGGINVFAKKVDQRTQAVPAMVNVSGVQGMGGSVDYPQVTTAEIITAQPDTILLPAQLCHLANQSIEGLLEVLCETPAVQNERIIHLDGSLITWYGTRLARALVDLPGLLSI